MKLEIIVLREISQICICQKDKYMFFPLDLKAVKLVVDVGAWERKGAWGAGTEDGGGAAKIKANGMSIWERYGEARYFTQWILSEKKATLASPPVAGHHC